MTNRPHFAHVQGGGLSRSGLVLPFLSFFVLSRFLRDFPDLLRDGPGIFPIRPFSLSRPIESTYEEQSRESVHVTFTWSRGHITHACSSRSTLRMFCPPVLHMRFNSGREKKPKLATSLAFYRSQKGLSLENSEKSPKRGSRGREAPVSKKLKKSRKKLKKGRKLEKNLKNSHFRLFFGVFFDPGAERPQEPFFRLFSEFFRERPFWLL